MAPPNASPSTRFTRAKSETLRAETVLPRNATVALLDELAARGLTLFDIAPGRVQRDLEQWQPICEWLEG